MRLTPPTGIMDVLTRWGKRGLAKGGTSVSVEENMALARRFLQARGKGDLDAMEQMMAPEFVDHTLAPGQELDREGYKRRVAEYAAAFSDLTYTIEDQVAGADKVVTRFAVSGTHDRRELMGVAPTGRKATNIAIAIHRISEEDR
jgi:predicted ester cyclase